MAIHLAAPGIQPRSLALHHGCAADGNERLSRGQCVPVGAFNRVLWLLKLQVGLVRQLVLLLLFRHDASTVL